MKLSGTHKYCGQHTNAQRQNARKYLHNDDAAKYVVVPLDYAESSFMRVVKVMRRQTSAWTLG